MSSVKELIDRVVEAADAYAMLKKLKPHLSKYRAKLEIDKENGLAVLDFPDPQYRSMFENEVLNKYFPRSKDWSVGRAHQILIYLPY